jgi:hypothetical protein
MSLNCLLNISFNTVLYREILKYSHSQLEIGPCAMQSEVSSNARWRLVRVLGNLGRVLPGQLDLL